MIIIIGHVFKSLFDAVIKGYSLHNIYGFPINLLGAFFSSITHLFILLYNRRQKIHQRVNIGEEKLRDIKIIPTNLLAGKAKAFMNTTTTTNASSSRTI